MFDALEKPVLSIDEQARKIVSEIVENLDIPTLLELAGGSEADLDKLFNMLYHEAVALLSSKMPKMVGADSLMYLDRFGKIVDIEFKKRDINYFTMSVFPEFDVDWHTIEWGHFVMSYVNSCFLAARGRGKSFFFSYILPLWKAYRFTPKNPNNPNNLPIQKMWHNGDYSKTYDRVYSQNGLIITASEELATTEFLPRIANAIETNPILNEALYPKNGEGMKQTSHRYKNGAGLKVKGYGGEIRGRHPDYLILDDVLTENQLYSKDARDKASKWFIGTVRKLVIKGQNVVVGTPFHEKDLYSILKKSKRWRVFEYPAIYPDGRILASRRFNYNDIKADREELGAIFFSRELLCKPVSGDSTIFPYEVMAKCLNEEIDYSNNMIGNSTKFAKIVMGCDLAISANTGADYSCYITVGVTTNGERYILNIWRAKGISYAEQKTKIKNLYKEFKHNLIFIEANQFQVIFPQELEKEGLPVQAFTTTKEKNLKYGLPSLVSLFERQKYVFPYKSVESKDITDTVLGELSAIAYTDKGLQATGTHDDCAMALYITEEAFRKNNLDFLFM